MNKWTMQVAVNIHEIKEKEQWKLGHILAEICSYSGAINFNKHHEFKKKKLQ